MLEIVQKVNKAIWEDDKKSRKLLTFSGMKETISNHMKIVDKEDGANNGEDPSKPTKMTNEQKHKQPKNSPKGLFGFLIGPLLFFIVLILPLNGLSFEGKSVLATLLWVVSWWITGPMALGAVSLLPIILLPMFGAVDGVTATKAFGDPLNFLFLGGFAIALALEKWRLHERIALTVIGFFGGSTSGIVLGILLSSGFISMWVSNTATAMMLLPIGTAVSATVMNLMKQEGVYTKEDDKNFTTSVVLGIAVGATIGGSATLIGTPPNLILAGLVQEITGFEIPFASWMLFAVPLTLVLMGFTAFYMTRIGFPLKVKRLEKGKEAIQIELAKLGKMTYEEKVVTFIFSLTIFFWLTRTFIWQGIIPGISDTMIAMFAAVLIYMWPASKKHGGKILNADSFAKMPWSVLLMIGGGLSIAAGFTSTDLATWIGSQLLALEGSPYYIILGAAGLLAITMTQVAPNTATTTILVPISAALAQAVGVNPIPVMVITALGAGFAFMLPIGTPTFGVVYASGKIDMKDMIKAGTWIVIAAFILIFLFTFFLFPVIMGIDPLQAI